MNTSSRTRLIIRFAIGIALIWFGVIGVRGNGLIDKWIADTFYIQLIPAGFILLGVGAVSFVIGFILLLKPLAALLRPLFIRRKR